MSVRHGGLSLAAIWAAALPLGGAPPQIDGAVPAVNSRVLDVSYSVHSASLPLQQVDLWVTADGGDRWKPYRSESSGQSPLRFRAEHDGVYGFFLVLHNKVGASSGPPQPGQQPHQWVLVDSAAPLVQIKQVRVIQREPFERPVLVVSWTAFDAHLGDRPVSLYYEMASRPGWRLMSAGIADVGRFDWLIRADVSGRITVKIEITDRAGNIASDISQPVLLEAQPAAGSTAAQTMPAEPLAAESFATSAAHKHPAIEPEAKIPPPDAQKAQELYNLGVWHKERGDYGLAVARLIEAMNYGPDLLAPPYDLAEIYHAEGNYHGALDIYKGILERRSTDREALRGSALAMVALRKYPEALQHLERVLQVQPNDAETWLHAGDVFLWMGQSSQARRYWQEAARLNPENADIAAKAKQRIEKYGKQQAVGSRQ